MTQSVICTEFYEGRARAACVLAIVLCVGLVDLCDSTIEVSPPLFPFHAASVFLFIDDSYNVVV